MANRDGNLLAQLSAEPEIAERITHFREKFARFFELLHGEFGLKIFLTTDVLPHIDDAFVTGRTLEADKRTKSQNEAVAISDKLIAELKSADVVVIASPMINFGLATTLKAWFDYVLRAGVTFKYSEKGPEGLMTGKKVFVVVARGGVYSQGPMKVMDFQEPYLRQLLAFIGIADVTFVPVEGVAYGPDAAAKAEKAAIDSIPELLKAA